MLRFSVIIFLVLITVFPALASVEVALNGSRPTTIKEVYLHEGVSYLPIDEVLPALRMSGWWDSVGHLYRIKTPQGRAVIFPGGHYLRLGERFIPLETPPRFIDGRLRVSEDFVTETLADLAGRSIYYRNLNPQQVVAESSESSLDRLFDFLLRKKKTKSGPVLRAVALDPGHGGKDPGSFGGGVKEKDVVLDVARRLEKMLKMRMGIPVYLSRDSDYTLSLEKRLEPATREDVDVLIQVHAQASYNPLSQGVTLFVRPQEEFEDGSLLAGEGESMRLARQVGEAMEQAELNVAGIYQAPLLTIGRGNLPTVLVELGYLSNAQDLLLLESPEGQEKLAAALFEGLKNFSDKQKEF